MLRAYFVVLATVAVFHTATVEGASRRYSSEEDTNVTIREMRDSLDALRHEVSNHENEIRMYEAKLETMESSLDTMRQQLGDTQQANKDLLKENANSSELKIGSMDTTVKGLVADLKQLKTHANDSATALGQYKSKLLEMEKLIDSQNQNIENLQAALRSLMDAMSVKSGIAMDSGNGGNGAKSYRVKPGDSLEKIARSQGTTISALKEANRLNNDKIVVGQNLKIP
jgi:chromosome segregation ATPase